MRKILAVILVFSLFVIPVSAEVPEIRVILDGVELEFDVPPMIIDNRTMVPMRAIFEALGAEVEWDQNHRIPAMIEESGWNWWNWREGEQVIIAMRGFTEIVLAIDNPNMRVGRGRGYTLDVPPMIVDNRTLVPLRAISEALNASVEWNSETRSIYIESPFVEPIVFTEIVMYQFRIYAHFVSYPQILHTEGNMSIEVWDSNGEFVTWEGGNQGQAEMRYVWTPNLVDLLVPGETYYVQARVYDFRIGYVHESEVYTFVFEGF